MCIRVRALWGPSMEQSRHPIDIVARQTGFGDRNRRAFLRAFGQPQLVMRRNARIGGDNFTAHATINQ
jgi:transcriptional regulator GlxA family with amidase domain